MIQKKISLILLMAILLIGPAAEVAHAEYIRATKQDEIILISVEKEVKMGESLARSVEKKFKLAEDVLLQKRINDIGQNIAGVCDRQEIGYAFRVILGDELKPEHRLNAFALPGGYIYVFKDLVEKFDDDDEIAAVLSHEVGHIAAKHSVKRLQASLGAVAFQILSSGAQTDGETMARAYDAITLLMMAYSREDEFMADKLGVKYSRLAGYDPEGSASVVDKLIEIQKKAPLRKYTPYRTHPYLSERKAVIRNEIRGRMEFDDFINMPSE